MKLVDEDMERAIGLVQQCKKAEGRAQALGFLAVRVAEYDKQRAWQLIDEALAIHRGKENAYRSWVNYGQGGPFAAVLACQANEIDYPDMESVVWHVLAACRAKRDVSSQQLRLKAAIGTARILALVDQQAAKDLLLAIADQQDQIKRNDGGISLYDQWLQAWLLVDFPQAIHLLQEDLEQLAAQKKDDALRYGHGAVFQLLTALPSERLTIVADQESGVWQLD